MNLEALKVAGEVIRGTGVHEPVLLLVGGVDGGCVAVTSVVRLIEAITAIVRFMTPVFANLTLGALFATIAATLATIAASSIVASSVVVAVADVAGVAALAKAASVAGRTALPWLAVATSGATPTI